MLKIILIVTILGVFAFGQHYISFSETEAVTQATPEEAVKVGNKICPVSGDKINEENKAAYEYEGKIYNFCCPMCIEEFKKDPEKYIKKIEEELQAQTKEEGEAMPASSESESMHKEHHH